MVTAVATPVENPVKGRKSFSIKYKRQVLSSSNELMLLGHTLRNAAEKLNVHHSYLLRYMKTVAKVDKLTANQTVIPFKIHGESCKIHPGHLGELVPIEGNLRHLIFELR